MQKMQYDNFNRFSKGSYAIEISNNWQAWNIKWSINRGWWCELETWMLM